jgi:hypothetical protein
MNRPYRLVFILPCLFLAGILLSLSVAAQDSDVNAAVAISVQQDKDIWAGQQVTLNLDLKTTGYSFSNTLFNLPEVSGAFLMQTDSTTIKLTEKIDGQTWQVIRYPLALYPQQAGRLEIPPVNVRFSTSSGFGSTVKDFELQTGTLELTINLPPGVKENELIVTTSSFELSHEWQPVSGTARTGDAITLKVSRRASDISAMLLPPLPVFQANGLAAYPQTPEVTDKTNRGDLSGERIDSIVWVVEKPGSYKIPGIRFQWWDPKNRELKQQIVPGIELEILPSASDSSTMETGSAKNPVSRAWLPMLLSVLAVLSIIGLWTRFGRKAPMHHPNNEKSSFDHLQKACRNNDPSKTHSAIYTWLASIPVSKGVNLSGLTLSEFARLYKDKKLAGELHNLQEVLVKQDGTWQGNNLLKSLQRVRFQINRHKTEQSKIHLAPLNP